MEKEKHCSQEMFQDLKKKSFRNIPRGLLTHVLEELPDHASIVYLRLYDLAEGNSRYHGTVIISHAALGEKLKKSESSIKRAIKILSDNGYLKLVQQGAKNKNYLPNIIHVLCPDKVAHKILQEEPDRKLTVLNFSSPHKEPSRAEKTQECGVEPSIAIDTVEAVSPSDNSTLALYRQYEEKRKALNNAGLPPNQACGEAFKSFTPEQVFELENFILEQAKKPRPDFRSPVGPNMNRGGAMNDLHKINNRDHKPLLLTTDKVVDNKLLETTLTNVWTDTLVNFEKDKAFVESSLSEIENRMIESKLRAMSKCKEIHSQLNLVGLRQLIAEVKYHVIYRDKNKTPTAKHALNAAATMLRKGTWSTPKRLAALCTQRMEQAVQALKERQTVEFRENSPQLIDFFIKRVAWR